MSEEVEYPIVDWKTEMANQAKAAAAVETPSLSYISLKAGIMTYMKQPVPGNALDVIVIGSAFERRYDTKDYDPNNFTPPDCYAISIKGDKDMVPAEGVKDRQSAACDDCTMNSWQPNPKKPGKKYKPCKEKRRLLLAPASVLKDGSIGTAELAMLNVPTMSLKNWSNHVNNCAAQYSRPPWDVITKVSVHPNVNTQLEVKFAIVGLVEESDFAAIHARAQKVEHLLLVEHEPYGEQAEAEERKKDAKPKKY